MDHALSFAELKKMLQESSADSVYFMDVRNMVLKDEHPSNPAVTKLHMRMGSMANRFLAEMLKLRKGFNISFNDADNLHRASQQFILEADALDIEDAFISLGTEFQPMDSSDYEYVKKMHMVNISPIRGVFLGKAMTVEIETVDNSIHLHDIERNSLLILRDGVLDVRDLNNPLEFKSTRFLIHGDANVAHLGGCVQVSYHDFTSSNVMGDMLPCGMTSNGDLVPLTGPNPRTFACPSINELQRILQSLDEQAA